MPEPAEKRELARCAKHICVHRPTLVAVSYSDSMLALTTLVLVPEQEGVELTDIEQLRGESTVKLTVHKIEPVVEPEPEPEPEPVPAPAPAPRWRCCANAAQPPAPA